MCVYCRSCEEDIDPNATGEDAPDAHPTTGEPYHALCLGLLLREEARRAAEDRLDSWARRYGDMSGRPDGPDDY